MKRDSARHPLRPAATPSAHRRAPGIRRLCFLFLFLLLTIPMGLACRTSSEPEPETGLSIRIDAVPLLLKADSLEVATVWATVLDNGEPVPDSTIVYFASTLGGIEPEAYTRDGLARVEYGKQTETGVAAIVAQVRAVRDTVLVTLF